MTNIPVSPAVPYNESVGHALYAAGGHQGKLDLTGEMLQGAFNPDVAFIPNDPVAGTQAALKARYLGTEVQDEGPAESGFGEGEATPLSLLDDLVAAPSNPLGIDPSRVADIRASIAKKNGGVEYYDLNCVVIGGQLADEYIVKLHATTFPPAPVASAPEPPAKEPVPATPSNQLALCDGRFLVTVPNWKDTEGRQGTGTALPITVAGQDNCGAFSFYDQLFPNLASVVDVLVTMVNQGEQGYWVKFCGATDVGFALVVTDTKHGGVQKTYSNPPGHLLGTVDTTAFAA